MTNRKGLGKNDAWLIYWHVCRGIPLREIAEEAGCSYKTVTNRLDKLELRKHFPGLKHRIRYRSRGNSCQQKINARVQQRLKERHYLNCLPPEKHHIIEDFLHMLIKFHNKTEGTNRKLDVNRFMIEYRNLDRGRDKAC